MNIIRSEVVSIKYDQLWEDISSLVAGAGVKPVLIIVNSCEPGSTEDTQLQKMLDACNLNPTLYNLLRLHDQQMVAWRQLRERLDPKIIFMIGVLPSQLGISAMFSFNAPNNFNDRVWLPTLSINELEKNKDIKLQLWNSGLKPLFKDNVLGLV